MPAFESRRVRTQPLTVTGAACGAWPARIRRTVNALLSIARQLLSGTTLSSDPDASANPGRSIFGGFGRADRDPFPDFEKQGRSFPDRLKRDEAQDRGIPLLALGQLFERGERRLRIGQPFF
jgi:hypothetical protein